MKRVKAAQKNHGKCELCPRQIKKGDAYLQTFRHATEKERNDPNVKTNSFVPGFGPAIVIKFHEACHEKRLHEDALRRRAEAERRFMLRDPEKWWAITLRKWSRGT